MTLSNVGGRSTYQNVASTRRLGLEVAWTKLLPDDIALQVAYTLLAAQYTGGFLACTTTPCTAPATPATSGNRIPGVARNALSAELGWTPPRGWRASVEARALSRVDVDDTNSDAASAFVVANVSAG